MKIKFFTGNRILKGKQSVPEVSTCTLQRMRRAEDHIIEIRPSLRLLRLYVQRYERAWLEL